MSIFDFFKKRKQKIEELPSAEQKLFAEIALKIIQPTVEKFGFDIYKKDIRQYSTTIVWRKDDLYVEVQSTTYPTDFPYYFGISLGEGSSDDFTESDWNCVPLWRLKNKNTGKKYSERSFPYGELEVTKCISKENDDLLKYGSDFMNSDLTQFYECRSEQNKNREPYRIYIPDKNGGFQINNEQSSVEQKNKYS